MSKQIAKVGLSLTLGSLLKYMSMYSDMTFSCLASMQSYIDAKNYWDGIDANIEGMLGGFGSLTDIDAATNKQFISTEVEKGLIKTKKCCDCGAGIGRVTSSFLIHYFERVDLVEQTEKFLSQARLDFEQKGLLNRIEFIPKGLQNFSPKDYDLIWCQWVLSQLNDQDLIDFLVRCKKAIQNNGGYIGIKENVSPAGVLFDSADSSCTRSDNLFKEIFQTAGLEIVKEKKQLGFPKGIYEVKMYLLK
jgi:protein N-terminal methyltransferase